LDLAWIPHQTFASPFLQETLMKPYPLGPMALGDAHLRVEMIERLAALIEQHIAQGRYPGCQIALARHGRLVMQRSFGSARIEPQAVSCDDRTLWLLYSNTKVIVAVALWQLLEQGLLRFTDRVSAYLPGFARHGKRDITLFQVITHQGGFPNAELPAHAWLDHAAMREAVCDFTLEWTPGSRIAYHGLSAHWVLASVIEVITGRDYRDHIREAVLGPLGLADELTVGLSPQQDARAAQMYVPQPDGLGAVLLSDSNSEVWRRAGAPGGGAYGSARAMVALYQMMLAGGELGGTRILSPRTLGYAIRNWTGDRVDEFMGMPMNRGLGPHLRGHAPTIRGLGALAPADAFGHGGVGTSYCWADPASGVSFAYITNNRQPDPWHSERLDVIANLVHAAILPD
jgi:CubicO group peptidase (beta-lactamase class C family)